MLSAYKFDEGTQEEDDEDLPTWAAGNTGGASASPKTIKKQVCKTTVPALALILPVDAQLQLQSQVQAVSQTQTKQQVKVAGPEHINPSLASSSSDSVDSSSHKSTMADTMADKHSQVS